MVSDYSLYEDSYLLVSSIGEMDNIMSYKNGQEACTILGNSHAYGTFGLADRVEYGS